MQHEWWYNQWPEDPDFLQADYTYDNEGRTVSVTYPALWYMQQDSERPVFTYSFDSMGRPLALNQTAPESRGAVSDVTYNAAGQITYMRTGTAGPRAETRQYSALQQLTRMTVVQDNNGTKLDYEYRFSATQNDGRITQRKDWLSGEEVEYQYDSLQRLSTAATTGSGGWGQSFGYDGFGNLLSQTVTKGSAPSMSVTVNPATNRITSSGTSYDANGNMTAMPGLTMAYDVSNRLISATSDTNGTDVYFYDPAGHRVYKQWANSSDIRIGFYGVDGSLLGEYTPTPYGLDARQVSVYFGKRKVWTGSGYTFFYPFAPMQEDRLGSAVYEGTAVPKYFPYGDEPSTTEQNRQKFATYYRDAVTALDYAQQRYYASTLGRFTTSDPYMASGGPGDPQSWNRYAYVQNDPVNFSDTTGLIRYFPDDPYERIKQGPSERPSFCDIYSDEWTCQMFGRSELLSYLIRPEVTGTLPEVLSAAAPPPTLDVQDPTKTGKQYLLVRNAFDRTLASLDSDCEAFLNSGGGNVRAVVSDLFAHDLVAVGGFGTRYSAFTNIAGTNLPAGDASIVFNTSSAFFTGTTGMNGVLTVNNGQIRGGTKEAQVFIVLHELAHLLSSQGFQPDFGHDLAGKQNDMAVGSFCHNTLKGFE